MRFFRSAHLLLGEVLACKPERKKLTKTIIIITFPSFPSCVHPPPHMEKKGIIGQKCVLCPPLLGESLSFCASSSRAMSLFGILNFEIFKERLFPISSLQSPKKFDFSEFFLEQIRFQKFPKKFFLENFPKI